MGGLLYKDFIAIKGKRLTLIIMIFTAAFITLRIIFPGGRIIDSLYVENVDGEMVYLVDTFFSQGVWAFLLMSILMINHFVSECVRVDEKNKARTHTAAMPLEADTYIASKYVFIGITTYLLLSLYFIWEISCEAFMLEGFNHDFIRLTMAFAMPLYSAALFIASIELSLFLILGRDHAMLVKTTFLLLMGLLAVYYLFFGDLTIVRLLDFDRIVAWVEAHAFWITLLNILSPFITLAVYYLSYRVTCALYAKREPVYE